MRGNICDVALFMVPELRPILRLLTMREPDGYLSPLNHVDKIKAAYPTPESIVTVSKEKIEELLFPGVLLLKEFRGSLYLFVDSVYPGTDPSTLTNLTPDEFSVHHVINALTKLQAVLGKATHGERIEIFKMISKWTLDLATR
jgi:hypothetical protein